MSPDPVLSRNEEPPELAAFGRVDRFVDAFDGDDGVVDGVVVVVGHESLDADVSRLHVPDEAQVVVAPLGLEPRPFRILAAGELDGDLEAVGEEIAGNLKI